MFRPFFIAAVLIAVLPSAPSFAVTAKEKAATCKFGADDQSWETIGLAEVIERTRA